MDDTDYEEETQAKPSIELEAGRVARLFLYKNRDRQAVRRPQLKPVLDEFREKSRKKRRDPIKSADSLLNESLGLRIVDGLAPGEKPSQSSKNFLVRTHKYPKEMPLPFTSQQKQEYGLLMFCFFIVHYKGNQIDFDQLWQILENSGVKEDSQEFGKWPEILNKWISQDYFKAKKKDEEQGQSAVPKKTLSLGPRFYAEFSLDTLIAMSKELVCDIAPKETEDEEENENENEGNDPDNIKIVGDDEEDEDEEETRNRRQKRRRNKSDEDDDEDEEETGNRRQKRRRNKSDESEEADEDSVEEEPKRNSRKQTQKSQKEKPAQKRKRGRRHSDIEDSD